MSDVVTGAVVSTLGTVVVGFLSFWGGRRDRSPRTRHQGPVEGSLRVVELKIPVPTFPARSAWGWRARLAAFLLIGVLSVAAFSFFFIQFLESEFTSYGWLIGALLVEIPAGLFIGWFIAMREVGMERAQRYTLSLRVAGEINAVVDRSTEILRKMKMRVHEVKLTTSTATIKASPQMEPKTLVVEVTMEEESSNMTITSEGPPSATSFRRNVNTPRASSRN